MTDLFPTITARDWRDSIKRSRGYTNSVSEQIKQHMSTNNDGWILMSERKPTQADLPILLWNQHVPKAKYCASADALRCQLGLTCFNAWMKAPAPPREKTQAEKDDDALIAWMRTISQTPANWTVWHAALAYERAEVAKLLPYAGSIVTQYGEYAESVNAIRARCGGGK